MKIPSFLFGALSGILLAVIIFVSLIHSCAREAREESFNRPPRFTPNIPANQKWKFASLDGENTELVSGTNVILINFWATWCGPCIDEMPSLQRLYDAMKGRDIIFACVSNEPPDTVKDFVSKKGWTLPMFVTPKNSSLPFTLFGLPTTLIIDRKGQVVFYQPGPAKWDSPEAIAFLDRLL